MDFFAGLKQTIARLGYAKIVTLGLLAAATVGGLLWVSSLSVEPKRLLYSDLEPAEAAKIGQKLEELKVPFETKGDGASIMVPASQVAHARMELAASGLPHQGGAGYDLLDQQSPMNMTSFMQRIQRLRALEGELARSIVTLSGVRSARVHIVLPERESFARETPKPTASVVVTMAGPGRLGMPQAAAIRLLVSGAVPGMAPESVSVLDPSGVVIGADDSQGAESGRLTDLKDERQHKLQSTVTELLEPLIGRNKVRVAVAVDLDTSREVSHEEKFDPMSQVERSKQIQTDQDTTSENKGQEPVSVSQNLPNQAAAGTGDPAKSTSSSTRNGQTVNYEISSTKSEKIREAGDVKRMTIAVVVDGTTDDKGQYQPRSKEELSRLSELVQSAVGFDVSRGDRVTVETMRFAPEPTMGTSVDSDAVQATPVPIAWMAGAAGLVVVLVIAALILMRSRKTRAASASIGHAMEQAAFPVPLPVPAALPNPSGQPVMIAALQPAPGIAGLPPELNRPAALNSPEGAAPAPAPAIEPLPMRPTSLASLFDLVDARPDEAAATLRSWLAEGP